MDTRGAWIQIDWTHRSCAGQTVARLTMLEMAMQAYRLRHGDWPDRLEQVIPADDWLIVDPFSRDLQCKLVYRRTEDGFLLYSVGYDGDDDGGKRPKESDLWDADSDISLAWHFLDHDSSAAVDP